MKTLISKCAKKAGKFIRNIIWAILDTGFVRVKTNDGHKSIIFRFLGISIFNIDKNKKQLNLESDRIIYFKINRNVNYTLKCIQGWINIANELKYPFIFVCDNNELRYNIYRNCYFENSNIKFIKSMKIKTRKGVKNLYTKHWKNATYAHLTPFYHAKKQGVCNFWNIDADDTTILLKPKRAAQALKEVEKLAIKKDINAISLDMWRSKTLGVHWSLGVLFIHDTIDFCKVFENQNDIEWTKKYLDYSDAFNLDWFMSYLKKYKSYKIETFYIENCHFIHWGELIFSPYTSWICSWKDGKIKYPILNSIYNNKVISELEIADCLKIDIGITDNECNDYFENEIPTDRFLTDKLRSLCHMEEFANKSEGIMKIK